MNSATPSATVANCTINAALQNEIQEKLKLYSDRLDNDPFGDGPGKNTETDLSVNISKISQKIEQLEEKRQQILDNTVEIDSITLRTIQLNTGVLDKELRKLEGLLEHIKKQKSMINTILENMQDHDMIAKVLQDFINHLQNAIEKINKKQKYSEETKKLFVDGKKEEIRQIETLIRTIQGKNKGCVVMGGTKRKHRKSMHRKKSQKKSRKHHRT